ncbi:very long chain fatty acid elongase AAEL008004 [Anabrus simplex]|uniref:very long chain fatty acid elongase AAEL008004 n=1 Tax=Anabrus simplex TaxID=316456 RepID=UPI0035A36AC9
MELYRIIQQNYHYYMYEIIDPRAQDVFYARSPLPCAILIVSYVYITTVLGPRLMKNRPAFKMDGVIRLYDVVQIALNAYFFFRCLLNITNEEINWQCMPVLHDNSYLSVLIEEHAHYFVWLKVFDLLDTIFFVLRKKFNQVSFLHVYHHAAVVFGSWLALRYVPGGNTLLVVFLNTFVHMIMFTYYLLTSINPEYKKSIWWKKYLTLLQMIQFLIFAVHSLQSQIWNTCGFPRPLGIAFIIQNFFIFALFFDFYVKAYGAKRKVV